MRSIFPKTSRPNSAKLAVAATSAVLVSGFMFAPAMAQTTQMAPGTTAGAGAGASAGTIESPEIIALDQWNNDSMYQQGWSADQLIRDMPVYGQGGDEIGTTEDLVMGMDGQVLALIAEIGGFWDIGDTHVSIPWSAVEISDGRLVVPVTEDNADEYGLFNADYLTAQTAETQVQSGVDDIQTGSRAWRVSELIGDYARIRDNDTYQNYGYVDDVIIEDGQIAATIISADTSYGMGGYRAYPYYGNGAWGWTPGNQYYDLPYTVEETGSAQEFDYDQLSGNIVIVPVETE